MSAFDLSLPAAPGTVLFDLDGTILDSSAPVLQAWEAALTSRGLEPLRRDELHRVIGPPTDYSAPEILADRGGHDVDVAAFLADFEAAITDAEVELALAYPDVVEVVQAVHDAGRRLAVVTSKPYESAVRVLPALGIDRLFVHLEAPRRGAAEVKDVTMGRAVTVLDLDPTDTVLVGDRHHDVAAGAAHGIATIGVTWGGFTSHDELRDAGAARVLDAPQQLLPALGV